LIREYKGSGSSTRSVFLDNTHVAICDNRDAVLLNVETGEVVRRFSGHAQSVISLAISPDRQRLLTGSKDNTMQLWEMETGKLLRRFDGHSEMVRCIAFTPDGRRAISGSYDHTLILWDLETGEILNRLQGHKQQILSVAVSPDGRFALSGGGDRTVRLWDLSTNTTESSAGLVRRWDSSIEPLATRKDTKKSDQ